MKCSIKNQPILQTGLLSAVDVVEVNPKRGKREEEVHLTASVAVDLVLSCFGRVREGSHPADYKIPDPWVQYGYI